MGGQITPAQGGQYKTAWGGQFSRQIHISVETIAAQQPTPAMRLRKSDRSMRLVLEVFVRTDDPIDTLNIFCDFIENNQNQCLGIVRSTLMKLMVECINKPFAKPYFILA